MNLLGFSFYVFFLCVLVLYYTVGTAFHIQKYILLVTSVIFLTFYHWISLVVFIFVSGAAYLFAQIVSRQINQQLRKLWLAVALVVVLGALFLFKYLNFALKITGFPGEISILNMFVPVGLSFYTFSASGYLIDVYRKKYPATSNAADHMLFLSLFPYVSSGPIERADHILPQIKENHTLSAANLYQGGLYFLWGAFLKLVLADRLGVIVNWTYDNISICSGTTLLLSSFLYTLQIYFDFSSYSYLAIGLSRCLGYTIVSNFKRPYFAENIVDFWRRWHISLTSWFRDYLYIPLGGNRKSPARRYLNIMIVFTVSGIWHGAAIHYLVWGVFHGLLQVFYILFNASSKAPTRKYTRVCSWFVTFFAVNIAWIFFRAPDMETAVKFISKMFSSFSSPLVSAVQLMQSGIDIKDMALLLVALFVVTIVDLLRERHADLRKTLEARGLTIKWMLMFGLFLLVLIFGRYGAGYESSNFIYFQY